MANNRILIAGGGIGGLATAIGLAQKGIASLVLEKASRLGEIGAGIQLGPNAFHAFDYLGVGDDARGMAVYIDNLRLMDAIEGHEITRIPLGDAPVSATLTPWCTGAICTACSCAPARITRWWSCEPLRKLLIMNRSPRLSRRSWQGAKRSPARR